eukprot:14652157-Alexandrium_andersonii.AAC.1
MELILRPESTWTTPRSRTSQASGIRQTRSREAQRGPRIRTVAGPAAARSSFATTSRGQSCLWS